MKKLRKRRILLIVLNLGIILALVFFTIVKMTFLREATYSGKFAIADYRFEGFPEPRVILKIENISSEAVVPIIRVGFDNKAVYFNSLEPVLSGERREVEVLVKDDSVGKVSFPKMKVEVISLSDGELLARVEKRLVVVNTPGVKKVFIAISGMTGALAGGVLVVRRILPIIS